MSLHSRLHLPREHGAWAMFYVPFALGVTVAGRINFAVMLLLVATTALFISRESLLVWWRARNRGRRNERAGQLLIIYFAIAAVAGGPLLLVDRLGRLPALAIAGAALLAINGKQATELEDRTALGEVMAIVGLAMAAPAAHYVASGQWTLAALWLWALSAAYFSSSVFYIKLRVTGLHAKNQQDKERARRQCIGYHSILVASLLVLAVARSLPPLALIAFAPVLARALWGLLKPARRLNLKRIGIAEVVYALFFLFVITLTFRSAV
jgi:YwiC-like protein